MNKETGRKRVLEIIKRWQRDVEKNPDLIKKRLLSEQDISTKFVLPMLAALNWDPLSITKDGPTVHEKGFRDRDLERTTQDNVRGGLPDFSLTKEGSEIPFFVEVKHPSIHINQRTHLRKYRDGHLVLLTSFRESMLVRIGKNRKKEPCSVFTACSPELYFKEFDNLWKYVSNSPEGDAARAALKAWRFGKRL